jgi:hypothetical protein
MRTYTFPIELYLRERRIKPGNYLGHLSAEEMEEIDEMMRIFGGLDPYLGLRF